MRTMQDIADQLSAMKFRKKTFGGVDEADVWKKLEALQEIYQQVTTRRPIIRRFWMSAIRRWPV